MVKNNFGKTISLGMHCKYYLVHRSPAKKIAFIDQKSDPLNDSFIVPLSMRYVRRCARRFSQEDKPSHACSKRQICRDIGSSMTPENED